MFNKILNFATILLSAFLLFQIQPMIAKIILPWFGGAAAVWITCMLFFQLVLLGGYVYAHWLINRFKPRSQVSIHVFLLILSVMFLSIKLDQHLKTIRNLDPTIHLLLLLFTSVGLPYFMLSTTSPLLQSWYARRSRHSMPYRLFALSNLASLGGLLAYPFFVEPSLTLSQQTSGWSVAYITFGITCISTALYSLRHEHIAPLPTNNTAPHLQEESHPPNIMEKSTWIMLATCASVLLLSTTNYLTQNVASVPFLWILPLSLYLLSFTLCFDRNGWYRRSWYVWLIVAILAGMTYALLKGDESFNLAISIPFFCVGLFACCMFCHGELALRKPEPKYLTIFYLMISIGGALGGVVVGIIVPKIFPGPFELALALNFCALLLFVVNYKIRRITDLVSSLLIAGVVIGTSYHVYSSINGSRVLERNFYGCLRVDEYDEATNNEYRCLVNGTIVHGIQFIDSKRRRVPVSYYSYASGIGLAMKYLPQRPRRVGIIGLGVGSLLAYARPGDYYRIYEINPLVENVARKEFSFISDCIGKVDILIGDGRLLLEQENNQQYDLLAVDAFSGDSIPVHLLTVEALQLYFRHLKPGGILAFHISNLHLDLAPIVEQLRSTLGKQAVLISTEGDDDKEIYDSDWVLMTSDRSLMKIPEIKKAASELEAQKGLRVWTDDYSNLIQIMKKFI